ncbi:Hypothetical predicted protein [Cloeon dipterum]|uniref:Uncharacterized protein n=1 Tax=Cloeon dipterum TaxID=197152 RepID=A0A8S1DD98_9INSE|nr:Hypothetical predicted protein [Cloeon dipterum]
MLVGDNHYRSAQRVAIALPIEARTADSSTKCQNLISKASNYSIPVIRGDLKSPDARDDLAERLMELIVSNTGAHVGFAAPISILN